MPRKRTFLTVSGLILFALLLFLLVPVLFDVDQGRDQTDPNLDEETSEQEEEEKVPTFTEEMARDLMTNYELSIQTIINDTNEDNELTTFTSEDEIRELLKDVTTVDHATRLIDTYIKEDETLYLISTGAPITLDPEQPFVIEEESSKRYSIVQALEDESTKKVEITYHVQWKGNEWLVADVESEHVRDEQLTPEEKAQEVIEAIAELDMERLASYVHEEKGVLFSPYVHIGEEDLVFYPEQIADFLNDEQIYYWGDYDGSGHPIELTPNEYFSEFLNVDQLVNPDQLFIDEYNEHGHMFNNHQEIFPEGTVVEFHDEGTADEGSIDWQSVHLVFEQDSSHSWKLVAIVSDEWTI